MDLFAQNQVDLGQTVWAYWEETGGYYPGVAVEYDNSIKGGAYRVVFFDTDSALVPATRIRPLSLKVGGPIYAKWTDGQYYPGRIAKISGLAVYIKFDDGDEIWTSYAGLAQKE